MVDGRGGGDGLGCCFCRIVAAGPKRTPGFGFRGALLVVKHPICGRWPRRYPRALLSFRRVTVRAGAYSEARSLYMDFYRYHGGDLEGPAARLSLALFNGSASGARQFRTFS